MSISQRASDYGVERGTIQTVRDTDLEMSDVAEALETGEVVEHDPTNGFAIVEARVTIEVVNLEVEKDVRLYLGTQNDPKPQIFEVHIDDI